MIKLPADIPLPTDRKFGLFFSFVFAAVSLYFAYNYGLTTVSAVSGVVAIIFCVIALLKPSLLRGLNRSWAYVGLLMGLVISPIVLGIIFFGLFTPIAAAMRLKGRDELRLKNNKLESNWIIRDPAGPAPESYKDQF